MLNFYLSPAAAIDYRQGINNQSRQLHPQISFFLPFSGMGGGRGAFVFRRINYTDWSEISTQLASRADLGQWKAFADHALASQYPPSRLLR